MKEFWDQYEFPFDPSEDDKKIFVSYGDDLIGKNMTLKELREFLREETPMWIELKFQELKERGFFHTRFATYSFNEKAG